MVELKQRFEIATETVVRAKIALEKAEAERDLIYQQISGPAASQVTTRRIKPVKGQAARILALLNGEPSKEWSYAEIEEKLPDIKKDSLRSFLFRLQRDGKAVKVGHGLWKMK